VIQLTIERVTEQAKKEKEQAIEKERNIEIILNATPLTREEIEKIHEELAEKI